MGFEKANSKVRKCKSVCGVVFDGMLVEFSSLFVVIFVFVDVSEIVPGVRVAGIDFDGFSVEFLAFLHFAQGFVGNSAVVICNRILRI